MRFNLSPYNFSFFDSAFHILILWRVKKVAEKEIFFSEFRSRFADQLFAEQAAEEVILVSPDFNPKMPFTRFHSVAFQKSVKTMIFISFYKYSRSNPKKKVTSKYLLSALKRTILTFGILKSAFQKLLKIQFNTT